MGILELMKSKYARKPGVTFANEDGSAVSNLCFGHTIKDESYLSFHVRRAYFDHELLQHAAKAGAEVRQGIKVNALNWENDRAILHCTSQDGKEKEYVSQYVIDASGQDSFMAKKLKCKQPFDRLRKRVAFSSHWQGVQLDDILAQGNLKIVQLEGEKHGWIWMIPLEDRLSIGVVVDMDYMKSQKKQLQAQQGDWKEAFYLQELHSAFPVKEVINGGKRIMDIQTNGDYSFQATEKFGQRFAIVGDAHAFLDPIFASGIYLAMKSAQLVAQAVAKQLQEGDDKAVSVAYEEIQGAYQLVEELIYTFYNPDSIKFTDIDYYRTYDYKKFEIAFSIIHFILAGDFFSNHERYLEAVELLRDEKMIEKYKSLIGHTEHEKLNLVCH
jgi:flavin-dependent dehydrogenase